MVFFASTISYAQQRTGGSPTAGKPGRQPRKADRGGPTQGLRAHFKISSLSRSSFHIVITLIVLKLLFITQTNFLLMLLRAICKNHILNLIIISFSLTELILIIIILFKKGDILDVALIGSLNHFFAFIFSYLLIKKRFGWFDTKKTKISFLYIKKIIYPSVSWVIPQLSGALIAQGTIIFIAASLNNNLLLFYNSMRIVMNGIKRLIFLYPISHCPEILVLFAKKKIKKVIEIYRDLIKRVFISSLTASIVVLLL